MLPNLTIKHYSNLKDLEEILIQWHRLWLSQEDPNPFCHPFFCISWTRTIGRSEGFRPIFITMFYKNRLKGVIPLVLNDNNYTLSFAGGEEFADYQDWLISSDLPLYEILEYVLEYLMELFPCKQIVLQRIQKKEYISFFSSYNICELKKLPYKAYQIEFRKKHNINALLLYTGGKKYLKDILRCKRKLKTYTDYEFVWYKNSDLALSEIADFVIKVTHERYVRKRAPDLTQKPNYREFITNFVNESYKWGMGFAVALINKNKEVIAAHIGIAAKNVLIWYLPAYSMKYKNFSPGKILLMETIIRGKKKKYEYLDLTWGDDPYKMKLKTDEKILFGCRILLDKNNLVTT